jgi:hypothetical protein
LSAPVAPVPPPPVVASSPHAAARRRSPRVAKVVLRMAVPSLEAGPAQRAIRRGTAVVTVLLRRTPGCERRETRTSSRQRGTYRRPKFAIGDVRRADGGAVCGVGRERRATSSVVRARQPTLLGAQGRRDARAGARADVKREDGWKPWRRSTLRGPNAPHRAPSRAPRRGARGAEARGAEARGAEARGAEARGAEARGAEARGAEARGLARSPLGRQRIRPVNSAASREQRTTQA